MDITPVLHRHQDTVIILTAIEGIYIIEVKIDDVDMRMILPDVIAQQIEHRLIEDAGHHIDVLSQIGKDLPGVFRRIIKRHDLEADIRAFLTQPRPQLHQHLCRCG